MNGVNFVDPMGEELDIAYFSSVTDEDREKTSDELNLFDWSYFFNATGHSLWNVASLGTLNKVENQKNLGTWIGVLQSIGSGGASVSNTITFGFQDSIYYTQMEKGAGIKSIWEGTKKAVIDLTPIEEIKTILNPKTDWGQKLSALCLTISKVSGYVAGYKGYKQSKIRNRVLKNIEISRKARVSSNFKKYADWDEIYQQVDKMDFSTNPDKGIFYSGKGSRRLAIKFAEENFKTPIDFTKGGSYLNSLDLYNKFGPDKANAIWISASKNYASGVSGKINLFVRYASPIRVFKTVEEPILKLNYKITKWIYRGY